MPAGKKSDPESLLPLTPRVFHILLALAEGPEHGYRIMKEVEERSRQRVRIGPGSMIETKTPVPASSSRKASDSPSSANFEAQ